MCKHDLAKRKVYSLWCTLHSQIQPDWHNYWQVKSVNKMDFRKHPLSINKHRKTQDYSDQSGPQRKSKSDGVTNFH